MLYFGKDDQIKSLLKCDRSINICPNLYSLQKDDQALPHKNKVFKYCSYINNLKFAMQKNLKKFHQNREGNYRIFAAPSLHLKT